MIKLNDSNEQFAMSAVAAAAAGEARAGEPELVHGAAPRASSLSLKDAERVIHEATEKLWRGSSDGARSFWQLLVNFFRWITRPFREAGTPNARVPTSGTPRSESASDINNVMSPLGSGAPGDAAAPEVASAASVPDDYLGDHFDTSDASDDAGRSSPVSVPKLAFPKSFAGNKLNGTPDGPLPLDASTIQGTMNRLQRQHPDVESADPSEVPITATVCLLEEFVSKVAQVQEQVRALQAEINTHLAALAALGDTPADQLLRQVLASTDMGGLQGDEIRRLDAQRVAQEQKAAEYRHQIENTLLNVKQQGLDFADIASRAKVGDALPDWSARLERAEVQEPAAPTPAERKELAIEVEPDVEIAPEGPSPERIARLRASLISSTLNDDTQQERPRG